MSRRDDASKAAATPTSRILLSAFLGAVCIPIVMYGVFGFPHTMPALKAYYEEIRKLTADELLLAVAFSLIEELLAVRRDLDSLRTLRIQMPLIEKMAASSLLLKVTAPLIGQIGELRP
jgi:hypothetical protein